MKTMPIERIRPGKPRAGTRLRGLAAAAFASLLGSPASGGLLAEPEGYTPERKWPVVVCTQNAPSAEVFKKTPYFLLHEGGRGVKVAEAIRDSLVRLAEKRNIDPMRIYATSFSRGGQEIIRQASQYPGRFAAIAPIGSDLRARDDFGRQGIRHAGGLRIPVLALYGQGDGYRAAGLQAYEAMQQAGVPVTVETYPGGHDPRPIWDTELNKAWMEFFARHRLDPYPREVTHWVDHKRFSRALWVQSRLIRDMGSADGMFTVSVKENNRIEVEANDKIAGLDLFLSDRLVDMNQPVTVVEGERELYSGPAAEKISVELRDGEPYPADPLRPLWEELEKARQKSAWMAELRAAGKDGETSVLDANRERGDGYPR
jgi:predicted esterase